MIDGKNFFDQPLKNDFRTYDNIQNIENGKGDNYASGCLLDYPYFEDRYKMIAIDLSKQQVLDADPKITKENDFRFFTRNCQSIVDLFSFNKISV